MWAHVCTALCVECIYSLSICIYLSRHDLATKHQHYGGFPGCSALKDPPASAEGSDLIPGSGRSPGEEMATQSSILAWRTPWTEEPGGLQCLGSQGVELDWMTKQQQQCVQTTDMSSLYIIQNLSITLQNTAMMRLSCVMHFAYKRHILYIINYSDYRERVCVCVHSTLVLNCLMSFKAQHTNMRRLRTLQNSLSQQQILTKWMLSPFEAMREGKY